MLGNVPLEGRCRFVLAAFCFNGNDLCAVLQNKINFIILVGKVMRLNFKLTAKLLQDIVFGQRTFELIVGLQKNCAVVDTRHVLEQSGVKYEELELIQLVKGRKRMLHLGNIVDAIEHSGRDQPFDRLFKVTRSGALTDSSVHEFFVGLGKLRNNAAEDHQDPSAVDLSVVL